MGTGTSLRWFLCPGQEKKGVRGDRLHWWVQGSTSRISSRFLCLGQEKNGGGSKGGLHKGVRAGSVADSSVWDRTAQQHVKYLFIVSTFEVRLAEMGEDPACVVLVLWQVGEHLDGLATLVLRQVQVRLAKLLQQVQNASCKIITKHSN